MAFIPTLCTNPHIVFAVHSFGTEGRKKDGPQIPPSEKIYDYVVFRGTDIKDLRVISLPPVETSPIHNDPAIIQLRYSPMGPASTPGSATISDQSSLAVQLGHARSTIEGGLPLYQAGKNIEYIGSTPPVANSSGFGMPRYCQGFYTPKSGLSHLPQTPLLSAPLELAIPLSLPQHAQFSTINSSFPSGTLSLHEATAPLPPIVSSTSTLASTSVQHSSIYSLFSTTPSSPLFSFPLAPPASCTPSLLSIPSPVTVAPTASVLAAEPPFNLLPNRSLVNSHPASGFGLNIPLAPPLGYINTPGVSVPENNTYICCGPSNESGPSLPFQTISQYMPSSINSFSSIKAETSLPIVTPGQLQHPSYSMLPSSLPVQTIHEDARFKEHEPKIKSEYETLTYELTPPATSMKEPLLPLSKHPSSSMVTSSLQVQTIHDVAKLKAHEPKIKPESEPSMYELPPPATSMMEPLLSLPKHPGYSMLPSSLPVQIIHEDTKLKTQEAKLQSESEPLTYKLQQPATSMKEPLLPLPKLAHRWPNEAVPDAYYHNSRRYGRGRGIAPNEAVPDAYYHNSRRYGRGRGIAFSQPVKFSKDFDFMAMNEKFNKAEVWGHLGNGKTLAEYDGQSSKVNSIREEDEESLKVEIQPAYSKDDFFDNLSSKSLEPGTHSGTARVSEQLKVDMETSGDSPRHRSNRGGDWGFRDGNRGRWRSNHDRGDGSNKRFHGRGFSY